MERLALISLLFFPVSLPIELVAFSAETEDANDKSSDASSPIEDQLKGKWVRYRETPKGRFMSIKEHDGTQTIMTVYDPNQRVAYSHRSDYTVDCAGDVCIFTYRNRLVLAGPGAGESDEKEKSYLFHVDGDRFLEVHGMMKDDSGKPSLIVWERLKVDPISKPDA